MSIQFSLGKRLLRAAVSLGFLGCLIAAGTVSSQAATSQPSVVASEAVMGAGVATPGSCGSRCANSNNCSDFMLTAQVEIGQPDEFGVALEDDDSLEMLRVDIQQRTFGLDRELIGPKIAVTTARNIRPSISLPLVV
jgi:hypothetical protein